MTSTQQRFFQKHLFLSVFFGLSSLLLAMVCLTISLQNRSSFEYTAYPYFLWGTGLFVSGTLLFLIRAGLFFHHYLHPPLWPIYYGEARGETWCCYFLEGRYRQAGQPGLSFLVHRDKGGRPCFYLMFKGREAIPSASGPTSCEKGGTCTIQRLCFCPCCGKDLDKWYRDKVDELARPELQKELEAQLPPVAETSPRAKSG